MAGPSSSTSEIQQEVKEACENYSYLTSILLDMGYESLLEKFESSNFTDCMAAIIKVIGTLEQIMDDTTIRKPTGYQYQAHADNIKDFLTRNSVRPSAPKQLHSRDLHKLHLDKVLGKIDEAKLKDFIKTYQTQKFLQKTNHE